MSDSETANASRKRRRSPVPAELRPKNSFAPTPLEQQRLQLAKLLQDPSKDVFIPAPAKEKSIRAPRDMITNVQGSTAGAGSGEFHVYKQSRRREYERLKLMDEAERKEHQAAESARMQAERAASADAKTAKNRAKRARKKAARSKFTKGKAKADGEEEAESDEESAAEEEAGLKRRLANAGAAGMTFRRAGDEEEDEEEGEAAVGGPLSPPTTVEQAPEAQTAPAAVANGLTILSDDW